MACTQAELEKAARYRERHREKVNAQAKERYYADLAQSRAYAREYQKQRRKKKPDAVRAADRHHSKLKRLRDPERRNAIQKKCRQAHPDRYREFARIAHQKRREAPGCFTTTQWLARFNYYGQQCAYCKCDLTVETVEVDHVIPVSRGGTHWPANLVPACSLCNGRKFTKRWVPKPVITKELRYG